MLEEVNAATMTKLSGGVNRGATVTSAKGLVTYSPLKALGGSETCAHARPEILDYMSCARECRRQRPGAAKRLAGVFAVANCECYAAASQGHGTISLQHPHDHRVT